MKRETVTEILKQDVQDVKKLKILIKEPARGGIWKCCYRFPPVRTRPRNNLSIWLWEVQDPWIRC